MGVEFFPCDVCSNTICDAGDFSRCYDCGRAFCSERCEKVAKMEWKHCDDCVDADEADLHDCYERICGYCKHEMVDDTDLLEYALESLCVSRDELAQRFLEKGVKNNVQ